MIPIWELVSGMVVAYGLGAAWGFRFSESRNRKKWRERDAVIDKQLDALEGLLHSIEEGRNAKQASDAD